MPAEGVGARVPASACARVHSVFRRACNIETQAGELVTLVARELGDFPHGIRCQFQSAAPFIEGLRPGQAAILDAAALRIPAVAFTVDFSRAAVWNGDLAAAAIDLRQPAMQSALGAVRAALLARAHEEGFAPVLLRSRASRSRVESSLSARLGNVLPLLAHATDARATAAALAQLVGLGPGLTPSGDDFIVGYLGALWSRSGFEPGIAALLRALAAPLQKLSMRTHAISRQSILDAVEGCFAERLVDVVRAVAKSTHVVATTLRALESGHSSGADTLCGLLFGFSPALIGQSMPPPLPSPAARMDEYAVAALI